VQPLARLLTGVGDQRQPCGAHRPVGRLAGDYPHSTIQLGLVIADWVIGLAFVARMWWRSSHPPD